MDNNQNMNLENKTYHVGTSQITYMVFVGLATLLLYVGAFLKPALFSSYWTIALITSLYLAFIRFLYKKGEKLIITADSIQLKGWFVNKKIKISEIASYKVMSSHFSGNSKIIIIFPNTPNKEKIQINSLPDNDQSEFIGWLEGHLEKKESLEIDKLNHRIGPEVSKVNLNLTESELSLQSYKVGKRIFPTVLLIPISITLVSVLISQLDLEMQELMYLQIGVVLFIMGGYIFYTIFIHNKLNILSDSIQHKGLLLNRKLKFSEIKGYKLAHSFLDKRIQFIVIVPNSNDNRPIKLRPTGKTSFIELTDWIEKNFTNLDK